jgi:hypothetical protein
VDCLKVLLIMFGKLIGDKAYEYLVHMKLLHCRCHDAKRGMETRPVRSVQPTPGNSICLNLQRHSIYPDFKISIRGIMLK